MHKQNTTPHHLVMFLIEKQNPVQLCGVTVSMHKPYQCLWNWANPL